MRPLAAALLAMTACATPRAEEPKPASAELAATTVAETMRQMQAAQAEAELLCGKLEGRPIPWSEERLLGGIAALRLAKRGGGLLGGDVSTYVQTVGAWVASGSKRPQLPWTFGVVDEPGAHVHAAMGGWVFVTTGLLRRLDDEAQLAAALALGIGRVSTRVLVDDYARTKVQMCRTHLIGAGLVQAGAASTPGGEEFVQNAKFTRTMRKFASPNWFDDDPEVDGEFLLWTASQIGDLQQLRGLSLGDQLTADSEAVELVAFAGYDPAAYGATLKRLDANQERQTPESTLERGKVPPFPPGLKLK